MPFVRKSHFLNECCTIKSAMGTIIYIYIYIYIVTIADYIYIYIYIYMCVRVCITLPYSKVVVYTMKVFAVF